MKWVNRRKETLKKRAKNNRNRRKFINEAKQLKDRTFLEYVQTVVQESKPRKDHVAHV